MNQKHAIKEQSRDHEKKSKDVNTKLATEFTYTCTIATECFFTRFPSKCEANTCIRLTYRKPCVFSNRTKYTLTCSRKNVEFGNESLAFPRMTTMVQERNCTIQQTDLSVSETRTSKITSLNVLETPKMIYKHFSFVSYQRYPNVLCDLLFCPSSLTQSTDILQHQYCFSPACELLWL